MLGCEVVSWRIWSESVEIDQIHEEIDEKVSNYERLWMGIVKSATLHTESPGLSQVEVIGN